MLQKILNSPLVIFLAIALRIYGSFKFPAQYYDMGTYEAWGKIMLEKGPALFFSSTWSDYLPLPIYFCSLIIKLTEYTHTTFPFMFKLTVSLLEVSLLLVIRRYISHKYTWLLTPLLVLSPALIGDSALWGQLDTIPALLTTLTLILLINTKQKNNQTGKIIAAAITYGLAVAIKPIMLITLPVCVLLLVKGIKPIKHFILFGIISFILFLAPAFPVSTNAFKFLVDKALEQGSTYPYTTVNAWNMWSVAPLGGAWPPDTNKILSLSAHTVGLIVFGVCFVIAMYKWKKANWERKYGYRIAGTLLAAFYVFTTRMHERHLLFGIPLLAVASLYERWLIIPTLILTATFSLNLWGAYYWVNNGQTWPLSESIRQMLSAVNVVVAIMLLSVGSLKEAIGKISAWIKANKVLILIIALAAALRIYNLSFPDAYIFDEVYHSFTAKELINNNKEAWEWWTTPPPGVAYEWTHPPIAKYGMVVGMLLLGETSLGWRIGSAVMGVLCILGIYYLTRSVIGNRIALLAAFLVSIEGLHVVQSRVGMNDMYMMAFLVWSLFCAVERKWKGAAVLFGLALGSKWSALYGVIPLSFIYINKEHIELKIPSLLRHSGIAIRLLLIAVIVYMLAFIPFLTAGHTWEQWWELHRQMWYYHTHLVATHAYQSTPKEWIFSLRPVWYFVEYGEKVSNIYAQGNPLLLWIGLASALMLIPMIRKFKYSLFILMYAVFTIPWVFSPRIMFFYHYLPSATFLCIILAAWLYEVSPRVRNVIIGACIVSFILMSPVYFGVHMPKEYWDTMFKIFPSWK